MGNIILDTKLKQDVKQIMKRGPEQKIMIPPIFFWEADGLQTAAFIWKGQNFGMSYEIDYYSNSENRRNKVKLIGSLKDTLDALVHHGGSILDDDGSINDKKLNDKEAERHFLDPHWATAVRALRSAMVIKEITKADAEKLKLL